MSNKTLISIAIGLLALSVAGPVYASGYNPNNVISVGEYRDADAYSEDDIQRFLERKGSGLAGLTRKVGGATKRISTLFYEASQAYGVSPKLLLATSQKEQSAISSSSLTQYQQDYLMGYAVYPGNDASPYKGIDKQIDASTWQFDRYMDKPQNFGYREGKTSTTSDGYTVTPDNQSTAALYNYTPHAGADEGTAADEVGAGGNFLFWKIWQNWFASTHPNGTLIRNEGEPGVYLLVDGRKRGFWSRRAFTERFSDEEVLVVPESEFDSYGELAPMTFPDGTLLQAPNGAMFVIENGKKRGITSREMFETLGYDFDQAIPASEIELDIHKEGTLYLEEDQRHPNGSLVKAPDNDGVFLMDNGRKRPVKYREVFQSRFQWSSVITISQKRLDEYPLGSTVGFRDGSLVNDNSTKTIYVIEDGLRRRIVSMDAFNRTGYSFGNVIYAPHEAVLLHEEGEDLDVL